LRGIEHGAAYAVPVTPDWRDLRSLTSFIGRYEV
jgi:hypothetical protein